MRKLYIASETFQKVYKTVVDCVLCLLGQSGSIRRALETRA